MLRNNKNKIKTLSEKVTELIAKPDGSGSSDEDSADEATQPRVVDFEEEYDLPDARSTDFRKRNIKLLSEQSARYKGKIITRKDWEKEQKNSDADSTNEEDVEEEEAYEESDSEDADNDAAINAFKNRLNNKQTNGNHNEQDDDSDNAELETKFDENQTSGSENNGKVDEDDDDEESDDNEESGDDEEDESDNDDADNVPDNGQEGDDDIIPKSNQQAEIQKGFSVQKQLRIWELLLELRINSQKVLTKANQLPAPEVLQTQKQENESLQQVMLETQQSTTHLLQRLLTLQGALYQQHNEVRQALKTAPKRSSPFANTDVPDAKRINEYIAGNFTDFQSYRNQVLLKWDDRTRLLTPGAGAKKKSLQDDFDILKKIDNTLANRSALIEKSQIAKGNNAKAPNEQQTNNMQPVFNGKNDNLTKNVNNYDDSDFYHQQLRELIEYKTNTTTNMSEITKQFVELQKLRQKMKKKVDTRASKGRKLRYVVHNKLVNFMAPDERCDWTDESINELSKSLFV